MTKRINNPLPYPYSQFFKEKPDVKNLNCLEDTTEQTSSNNNFVLIILIIFILFNSRPISASQNDESNLEASSDSNFKTNLQPSNENNYYE